MRAWRIRGDGALDFEQSLGRRLSQNQRLFAQCEALHNHLRARTYSDLRAVFLVDGTLYWASMGGPREKRFMSTYGHQLIGYYNRGAKLNDIFDDVLAEVKRQGVNQCG